MRSPMSLWGTLEFPGTEWRKNPANRSSAYALLCQPVHFNKDNSVESGGKDKTGNEDEDLESRLPKT